MRRISLLALALAAGLPACRGDDTLTVAFAVPGHWYRAVRLALEDQPNPRVTVIWDTVPGLGGGAGGAVYWADWNARQGADVVVGHDASRPSVGAAGVYNREQILQLAPVATSGLLEAQGPWSFGLVPNGAVEGAFIAAFADTALGARRVAVMYNNDEFGRDLREGLADAMGGRGMTVVDERYFSPVNVPTAPDALEPLFRAALRARPDVIVLAGRQADLAHLMRVLRSVPGAPPVISSDGAMIRAEGHRDWAEWISGLYVVRLWNPDSPASREFAARFAARWGERPDDGEALTYDAARLVLAAAADGARSARSARSWISQLGRGRPPFPGLSTEFSFRDGRPFQPQLWMYEIRAGRAVPARREAL